MYAGSPTRSNRDTASLGVDIKWGDWLPMAEHARKGHRWCVTHGVCGGEARTGMRWRDHRCNCTFWTVCQPAVRHRKTSRCQRQWIEQAINQSCSDCCCRLARACLSVNRSETVKPVRAYTARQSHGAGRCNQDCSQHKCGRGCEVQSEWRLSTAMLFVERHWMGLAQPRPYAHRLGKGAGSTPALDGRPPAAGATRSSSALR